MNIEDFLPQLDKFQKADEKFNYRLGEELIPLDITTIEKTLDLKIPDKIKEFYLLANGLKADNPSVDIIEMKNWNLTDTFIHFATFDNSVKLYFDTSHLNAANEWTILNKENKYEITLSISSFWSNKIWHWIKHKRNIWEDHFWTNGS